MSRPATPAHGSPRVAGERDFRAEGARGQVVRGGALTMAANAAAHTVRILITIILARLLTPEDFGLVAMVVAVIGVAQILRDMGLSTATVQRPTLSDSQLSAMFWINTGVGVAMMLACAALAPLLASFYGSPKVQGIALALAAGFFLTGLATQHRALLRRQLRFGRLAVISLGAVSTGFAVALVLAAAGWGYWALVASTLVIDAVALVLSWSLCRWRPGRPRFDRGVWELVSYGGHVLVFNVLGYFAYAVQPMLIGWTWDAADVGIYSRAHALMYIPVNHLLLPLSLVMVPVLARLARDPSAFRDYYLRAVSILALLALPAGVFCYVFAEDTIAVLYGGQWGRSVEVFRWLAVSVVLFPLFGSCAWIYQACARTRELSRWGLLSSGTIILAAAVAVPFGLNAVAASHSLSVLVLVVPAMLLAYRATEIRPGAVLGECWRPLLAALAGAAAAGAASSVPGLETAVVRLPVAAVTFGIVYLFVLSEVLRRRAFLLGVLAEMRGRSAPG